jgi:hypothetical protein
MDQGLSEFQGGADMEKLQRLRAHRKALKRIATKLV